MFVGFCFKISAVPFHMWTPDVYEGAPTPVTAFFAAAPKVAGIAIFVRATMVAFPGITHEWQQIVVFVSIASMVLGAFAAIGQRNIKRLMAYSSIGHMGFALVGLAAGTAEGVQGVLVYMSIYVAMTLGIFAVILAMRRDGEFVENISDLAGLARTHPTMAFFLAMLLFSLAGIPPLAGFFAKFYVFLAAIKAGLYTLAVIGVLTSVVGAYLLSAHRQDHVSILAMRRDGKFVETIGDLAGLARTHPTMAFFLAMLLFSLAGIPPLAGFFAKFYVFLAAIKAGLYTLAVIGVLSSVVGAYYYLNIVKMMYFDEPVKGFDRMPGLLRLVLGVSGLTVMLFFAYPAPILDAATVAAKSLF